MKIFKARRGWFDSHRRQVLFAGVSWGVHGGEELKVGVPPQGGAVATLDDAEGALVPLEKTRQPLQRFGRRQVHLRETRPQENIGAKARLTNIRRMKIMVGARKRSALPKQGEVGKKGLSGCLRLKI